MRRRDFLGLLAGAGAVWPVHAPSQPARPYRIGVLANEEAPSWDAFRQGLGDLGYVDGRNVTIEWRWAKGRPERFPELATELVSQNVDVIVTSATQASLAARQATSTIPIVMTLSTYPDKLGLVHSLAQPGGNVTGLTHFAPELAGKRLELLREVVPTIARVAVLWNPDSVTVERLGFQEVLAAAALVGIEIQSAEARSPEDLSTTLIRIASSRPDALYAFGNPVNFKDRKIIVDFAADHRIPAVYEEKLFVRAGGFMSYAPSFVDLFRRAATYVDKIIKGAKPADLPIEQPTTFELALNLKAAKVLGLSVSPSLLARADEVID